VAGAVAQAGKIGSIEESREGSGTALCESADLGATARSFEHAAALATTVGERAASGIGVERCAAIAAGSAVARAAGMMRPDAHIAVYVCVTPVDMRKQAATLALIVEQTLKRNIFEPALYVFSNERRKRVL
jgi:hypothetical protein